MERIRDKFEINGKITKLPTTVYANITKDEIWTFKLNGASPFAVVKPLLVLLAALFLLA